MQRYYVKDLARLCGVKPRTVRQWRFRKMLPEPKREQWSMFGSRIYWTRKQVRTILKRRGQTMPQEGGHA